MHNLNLRLMVLQEKTDCWMPAVTLGEHFKANDGTRHIDRDTGYMLEMNGNVRNTSGEFTAVTSKTIEGPWSQPVIVSAGLRHGSALHTGLYGFSGDQRVTYEGNIFAYLTERLGIGAEYRQKPSLINSYSNKWLRPA